MRLAFDSDQEELRATARAFLAEAASSEALRRAIETPLGYDETLWRRIGAELGWCALLVPEEYGGLGLSFVELVALLECTGEALLASPFFATVALGGSALLVAGTPEQRSECLPALAEGRLRLALAFSEASGRWDSRGVALTARQDGDGFVLEGAKRYVIDGHCADRFVVAARAPGSEGHAGLSLFLVDAQTAGLRITALPTLDPTRRLAQLDFSGVRVPAGALMGAHGEAADAFHEILDRAAIALAAEQVGGAQRCLDLAVGYAKQRVQFGRPIGTFQAIQHKCADMLVAIEAARSALYYAACVVAEGEGDRMLAASLAKASASDAFFRCAADNLQIHGGVGITWEYDAQLYFKRARASEACLGDASLHRERIAKRLLDAAPAPVAAR